VQNTAETLVLAFIGHLTIALIFMLGFYLLVSYSSLNTELENMKHFRAQSETLLKTRQKLLDTLAHSTEPETVKQQLTLCDYELHYCKAKHNMALEQFNLRKKSIFSFAVLALCKKFKQNFSPLT
jgi:hypothetical protein